MLLSAGKEIRENGIFPGGEIRLLNKEKCELSGFPWLATARVDKEK